MLIIVSDGRGIFSKGRAQVAEAIKKAKSMGIFIILIIVDNPKAEKSIKDIKVSNFSSGLSVRVGRTAQRTTKLKWYF